MKERFQDTKIDTLTRRTPSKEEVQIEEEIVIPDTLSFKSPSPTGQVWKPR